MPRTCTVCTHANRTEIEVALVNRAASYRDISRQFGVSKDAVSRHVNDGHIAERLRKVKDEEDLAQILDVTNQLKLINYNCRRVMSDARGLDSEGRETGEKDPGLVLRASDRVLRQLELQAKLMGQLDESPKVQVNNVFIGETVQAVILGALAPYPDARLAVADALGELEGAA